mmetsp:Transcript_91015/g.243676  ORF Transcript_91015/g.243676 Transcript_91015/m.243676 type:complete len:265 (+) Transcript_91015:275-1069(+)
MRLLRVQHHRSRHFAHEKVRELKIDGPVAGLRLRHAKDVQISQFIARSHQLHIVRHHGPAILRMSRSCQVRHGEGPLKNSGHFQHELLLRIHSLNTLDGSSNHGGVDPLLHVDLRLQWFRQDLHPPVGDPDVPVLLELLNGFLHVSWISGGHSHDEILQLFWHLGLLAPQRLGNEFLHRSSVLGQRLGRHVPAFRQCILDRHMVFRWVSAYQHEGQIVADVTIIRRSRQSIKTSAYPPEQRHGRLLAFCPFSLLYLTPCPTAET